MTILKRISTAIRAKLICKFMQNFQLSAFLKISGIGAASGIVNCNKSLYIISDNSGFLFQYILESHQLVKHSLKENASENNIKSQKSDFESISLKENELHIFGSGSTSNRNKNVIFNIDNHQIQEKNLSELYENIKKVASISSNELNIEGSFFYNEKLYLFQRGNGENGKNGIAIINQNYQTEPVICQTELIDCQTEPVECQTEPVDCQTEPVEVLFTNIKLPKINHIETSFTDAILVENTIYFLAAAEDTKSTYEDGEVLGSILGAMNLENFEINYTIQISNSHKFEGLTVFEKTNSEIIFLLCEDNDTETLETTIYKLTLQI
jgi:hypothetical protein